MNASRKSLILTALLYSVILTVVFLYASKANNLMTWLSYTAINTPHGWTMMRLTVPSDYRSAAGLLYTIAPPVAFTVGIYLQHAIAQRKAKAEEEPDETNDVDVLAVADGQEIEANPDEAGGQDAPGAPDTGDRTPGEPDALAEV